MIKKNPKNVLGRVSGSRSSAVSASGCEAYEGLSSSLSAAIEVNLGTAIRQEGSKEGKKEAEQRRDGGVKVGGGSWVSQPEPDGSGQSRADDKQAM